MAAENYDITLSVTTDSGFLICRLIIRIIWLIRGHIRELYIFSITTNAATSYTSLALPRFLFATTVDRILDVEPTFLLKGKSYADAQLHGS